MHIDPVTGAPLFVLDQMMMEGSVNTLYKEYGIHGIYYAVLFGWPGSPFASITSDEERDRLVYEEVYGRSYYDFIRKEDILPKSSEYHREQYKRPKVEKAIKMIAKLARVPVIEEKLAYLKWIDANTAAMNSQSGGTAVKQAEDQGKLLKSRGELTKGLNETLAREKELLVKKDALCSLDDFM